MAEYNQLLEQRYNRALKAQLGLEEQDGVGSVEPSVQPVIVLEDDRPEMAILKGEALCSGFSVVLSGAVNTFAQVQLLNPAGSNLLAVVTDIYYIANLAGRLTIGAADSPLQTLSPAQNRNDRRFGSQSPSCQVREDSPVGLAAGQEFDTLLVAANVPGHRFNARRGLFVLSPGRGITVGSTVLNQLITVVYRWYERTARTSEQI